MGITINWRLAQQQGYKKPTLDHAEAYAKQLKEHQASKTGTPFTITRSEDSLLVNIGGCETLFIEFRPWNVWMDERVKNGWTYEGDTLAPFEAFEKQHQGAHYEQWPDQKLVWASGFCKTQYAEALVEHKWVADILAEVAKRCVFASVSDEGDYYHTGNINDAGEAIESLGKMINNLGNTLAGAGFEVQVGGQTKIKSYKKK